MQNLIKGERYLITHPHGMWEGEADYSGEKLLFLNLKLSKISEEAPIVRQYFETNPCDLCTDPEVKWKFELLNINLENV